jgi:hypothetical protein
MEAEEPENFYLILEEKHNLKVIWLYIRLFFSGNRFAALGCQSNYCWNSIQYLLGKISFMAQNLKSIKCFNSRPETENWTLDH